ncbi:hAT family dimerization protein [Ceratobasidium sp. AG-Ba]|nr:hAT family dimerization protein [Ceratobasidium sp. AG-Ba]
MPPKLWHWEYFSPRNVTSDSKPLKDYHGKNGTFLNAWCNACLNEKINTLRQEGTAAKESGQLLSLHTEVELTEHARTLVEPVSGRREGFEAHIKRCKHIDPQAKARLENETSMRTPNRVTPDVPRNALLSVPCQTSSSPGLLSGLSKDQQKRFESDLCKLWVANGFPWHAINQPQTQLFFQNWLPEAKLPDRHKLSGDILRQEVELANASMREAVKGRIATGMSDGWKNIKRNYLLASMLSVDYKTYTVKVHDMSARRKTADNHLNAVLADIDEAEKYGVRVIAWVSDAGGDSRAMRVRLHRMRPHILVFDCWAHQVNLVVGDILRLKSGLVRTAADAIDIIKWMLNHSYLLGLLHEEQVRATGRTHSFSVPSITRWTAHFLSFSSLISESRTLRSLVTLKPEAFRDSAGRSSENKQLVERIIKNIEDQGFWRKLSELKHYLEPLAIAANVSQAPTTRLDHILIPRSKLVFWQVLNVDGRRLIKIPLLAVFLNPFIRARLFNPQNTRLNRSSLYGIAKRVFRRVFQKNNDLELHEAFLDYYEGRNEFHPDRWDYEELRLSYEHAGRPINLVSIWSGLLAYKTPNSGRHQLAHLAIHVLSIVANSAGCERLFSEMGHIHTKRRAQLTFGKVFDTAVVRMDLKRKHAAEGMTRARLQRQFGSLSIDPTSSVDHNSESNSDQHDETAEQIADTDMMDEDPAAHDITALAARLHQDVLDDEDPLDEESETAVKTEPGAVSRPSRTFFGTQTAIPLAELFNYSHSGPEGQGLDAFMKGGLVNLQKELEIYDLATREAFYPVVSDKVL